MFESLSTHDLAADEIDLFGFDDSRTSDLAARTARLAASGPPDPAAGVEWRT